jgi:excisionase family DNA binding protein
VSRQRGASKNGPSGPVSCRYLVSTLVSTSQRANLALSAAEKVGVDDMRKQIPNEVVPGSRVGKPEMMAGSRLLTPEQCAAFLQIEVTTLYVMKSQGRIPYRKVGHLLRFDLSEIVEWTKPKAR